MCLRALNCTHALSAGLNPAAPPVRAMSPPTETPPHTPTPQPLPHATPQVQGGILNFEPLSPDGQPLSYRAFEREAAAAGFHVRTGAECNPGACYAYLGGCAGCLPRLSFCWGCPARHRLGCKCAWTWAQGWGLRAGGGGCAACAVATSPSAQAWAPRHVHPYSHPGASSDLCFPTCRHQPFIAQA